MLAGALLLVSCSDEPRTQRQDPSTPNPPSRGFIDMPAPDSVLGIAAIATGWAVDESGVQRVRVYVDDRLVANVPMTVARPDVEKVFPQFASPGAIHGWQAEIPLGDRAGYVTIYAEALDGKGALTRVASVTVKVSP